MAQFDPSLPSIPELIRLSAVPQFDCALCACAALLEVANSGKSIRTGAYPANLGSDAWAPVEAVKAPQIGEHVPDSSSWFSPLAFVHYLKNSVKRRLEMGHATEPRTIVKVAAVAFVLVMLFALVEIGSSLALIYQYRLRGTLNDGGLLSSLVIIRKAATSLGLNWISHQFNQFEIATTGGPLYKQDDVFGVAQNPGEHTVIYRRKGAQDIEVPAGAYTIVYKRNKDVPVEWENFPVKVTINDDGSRWTGLQYDPSKPSIYIFGDSWMFGTGVNDEQTFSYHLQMARKKYNVRLFAVAGQGLSYAYLRFEQMKADIRPDDIIIIGYADWYDTRNVAASSRLRDHQKFVMEYQKQHGNLAKLPEFVKLPKAEVGGDGTLSFSLVAEDYCRIVPDYCEQPDPPQAYMTMISARLLNTIAAETDAKVYLLHIDGRKTNPIFQVIDSKIIRISALLLLEDLGFLAP